jgi:hypothetical protein
MHHRGYLQTPAPNPYINSRIKDRPHLNQLSVMEARINDKIHQTKDKMYETHNRAYTTFLRCSPRKQRRGGNFSAMQWEWKQRISLFIIRLE